MTLAARLHAQRAWLALAALLVAGTFIGWTLPSASIDWQPERALEQPWRLWSAAFAHWSVRHLAANLAGCAVVATFGVAAQVPGRAALAWFLAWPLTHAALALRPDLASYGGLSGVLHAGVSVAAWHLAWHDRGRRRALGVAVLLGTVAKLLLERPWGPALVRMPEWDFAVAPLAHLTGALAGVLCSVAVTLGWPRSTDRRPSPP